VIDEASMAGAIEVPEDKGGKDESNEAVLGTAQVVYDTVLVRDEPKTGNVVARLVRGTRVQLLSKKGSWYKIKFNDREGWVYRGSIAQ
jgi:SH3-like domain-containing protein